MSRDSLGPPDIFNFKIAVFIFLDGKIQNRFYWIFGGKIWKWIFLDIEWKTVIIKYQ